MTYHFSKIVQMPFDQAGQAVTKALAEKGFGVLTAIDVTATLKKKLDVAFRRYTILGACNPEFAYRALTHEDKMGTMLRCNVILQEKEGGVEVSAVDPVASMQSIENPALGAIAGEVRQRLRQVVEGLRGQAALSRAGTRRPTVSCPASPGA